MPRKSRKIWSVKNELLTKSREAMLAAVQIFNNPNIVFKSESFIVLSNIAWTYLMHAYYRDQRIDYKYFDMHGTRKRFDKTKRGAFKYWELERCLNEDQSPIDKITSVNLRFLIGPRHEIEHQMTSQIDDYLSARFQACCLNYNHYVKKLFGDEYAIDKHLSFSLQFSSITEDHANQLKEFTELPSNIAAYINDFDKQIGDEEFDDPRYSYRVFYVPKTVNTKGKADRVIEFIKPDSPEAVGLNKEYVLIKEKEKNKHLASGIVKSMKDKGFRKFGMFQHTSLWRDKDAKNPAKGFGVMVVKSWYWYDSWVNEVEEYCKTHKDELT